MPNSAREALRRVEDGRASQRYILAGVPKKYHDRKVKAEVLDALIDDMDDGIEESFIFFTADSVEEAGMVGAMLTKFGVDSRKSVSMIGLRALNSVYKSSFRNPDLVFTLRDKVKMPKMLVIVNIDESSHSVWRDCRDLAWLQTMIQSRTNAGKITVFCMGADFPFNKVAVLLGKMNSNTFKKSIIQSHVKWRRGRGGEIRLTIHNKNSKRA